MLDLICRRYPNRLPSDYLKIDNEYDAFQFDYAIAKKHESADRDRDDDYLDAIQKMLMPIGTALGVQYKPPSKKANVSDEPMDIDDALAIFGAGKGIVVSDGTSK